MLKGTPNQETSTQAPSRRTLFIAECAVRLALAIVFIVNVQCAVGFIAYPGHYASAYELSGIPGYAAVRGMGVVFLMWNATYPAVIVSPRKHRSLGWVVLVQQCIGLIGELFILTTIPAGHEALDAGIIQFAVFDGFGLAIMAATWLALMLLSRRARGNGDR